jgi:hypothetical protein
MKLLQRFAFHPFLLSVYPVLALLAHNIEQVRVAQATRPLVLSLIGTGVVFLILRIVLRDWRKAAIVCTLGVILFFSYGHIYELLQRVQVFGTMLGRHRHMLPIWLAIFALGWWWVGRRLQSTLALTSALNAAAIFILILPVSIVVSYELRFHEEQTAAEEIETEECTLHYDGDQQPPDVYYIILDAYTREDVLQEVYDFDNREFLNSLEELGFYVAKWSQSNYGFTGFSLSSSLNMNYLEVLDERLDPEKGSDFTPLWPLLTRSLVRRNLECLGYDVVAFDNGYYWSGWRDADIFLQAAVSSVNELQMTGSVNPFESMLIQSSAALILNDAASVLPAVLKVDVDSPYREHRERILYQFDSLKTFVPSIQGPKFVFAHIIIPHPPFVLDAEGNPVDQEGAFTLDNPETKMPFDERLVKYLDQIKFANREILSAVRKILEVSDVPPVIIIQGDHGLDGPLSSQMAIINAYYLPDGGDQYLYDTISPVNSFRIVFDYYFNGDYGLIDDISYYSRADTAFDYILVPNEHANP